MNLTEKDRMLLMNQFRILQKLDSTEAEHYDLMAEIVERGYTREYPRLAAGLWKELNEVTCGEVYDILGMFQALHYGYMALEDKTGIDAGECRFGGFDGNNEREHLSYASFLIKRLGHWQESKGAGDGLNSHHSTLDRYRAMVEKWKASTDPHDLKREDIFRITSAD